MPNTAEFNATDMIDDMLIILEKQLNDTQRVLSLLNETKMDTERKIERLYLLRGQQS
jgi:hypothetical protein